MRTPDIPRSAQLIVVVRCFAKQRNKFHFARRLEGSTMLWRGPQPEKWVKIFMTDANRSRDERAVEFALKRTEIKNGFGKRMFYLKTVVPCSNQSHSEILRFIK